VGWIQTLALPVHHDKLLGLQAAFVETAGGDEQLEGIPRSHHAIVAAGAQRPAAAMEITAGLDQFLLQFRERQTRHG